MCHSILKLALPAICSAYYDVCLLSRVKAEICNEFKENIFDLAASLRGEMALLTAENDPAINTLKKAQVMPPVVGVIIYKPFETGGETGR